MLPSSTDQGKTMPIGRGYCYATVLACILQFLFHHSGRRRLRLVAPPRPRRCRRTSCDHPDVSPWQTRRPRSMLSAEPPSGVSLAPRPGSRPRHAGAPLGAGQPGTLSRYPSPPMEGAPGMAKDAAARDQEDMVWGEAPCTLGRNTFVPWGEAPCTLGRNTFVPWGEIPLYLGAKYALYLGAKGPCTSGRSPLYLREKHRDLSACVQMRYAQQTFKKTFKKTTHHPVCPASPRRDWKETAHGRTVPVHRTASFRSVHQCPPEHPAYRDGALAFPHAPSHARPGGHHSSDADQRPGDAGAALGRVLQCPLWPPRPAGLQTRHHRDQPAPRCPAPPASRVFKVGSLRQVSTQLAVQSVAGNMRISPGPSTKMPVRISSPTSATAAATGSERTLNAGFTRYSVILTGGAPARWHARRRRLPGAQRALPGDP